MSTDRPRVLMVGAFPPKGSQIYGGIVTTCRTLVNSSLSNEFDFELVDSTQISNPPPGLTVRLALALRRFIRFVWSLVRRRPDAVVLFTAVGGSVVEKGAMAWVARLAGFPVAIFPRGGALMEFASQGGFRSWLVRVLFRGANKVFCQGAAWQRFAIVNLGFPPRDAPIIPNWTATAELLAVGRNRQFRRDGPVRLLFVGWVEAEKGIHELLSACEGLLGRCPFHLTVVGNGNAFESCRRFVAGHSLVDAVDFAGWAAGSKLERYYSESDVLVLPSWAEGLPNAMIEAMAAGVAVVVSRVGNVPDFVEHGVHGLLVDPKDVSSLTNALHQVITNDDLRHWMSKNGYELARETFSIEPAVGRLGAELRGLITKSG